MRRLVIAVLSLALATTSARADGIGLGFFFGDPTGLDLKIDLQRRSALDIVIGLADFRERGAKYAHLTYLVTPIVARGRSRAAIAASRSVIWCAAASSSVGMRRLMPIAVHAQRSSIAFSIHCVSGDAVSI